MKPLTSVHVVNYSCGNCGEEEEHAKLCSSCKAPMRIIQVVELYGEEADEFLQNLKQQSQTEEKHKGVSSIQYDDSVVGINEDDIEEVEDPGVDDGLELGDIYPDEDDDEKKSRYVGDIGDDFESALDILDQEDEDDDDLTDLPEL